MNDDPTLLASAYLDGDVDETERARVEADPALLAEVERLRHVRMLLGDTEPSSISTREALLANALDVWDRLPTAERIRDATPGALVRDPAAATIQAPTSLGARRRAGTNRRLLAAAAAIVVVLGGGIAAQVFVGGDGGDDSETVADAPEQIDTGGDDAAATEATIAAEAPQELSAGADVADGSTELDTGIDDPAPPSEIGLERLSTPDDLAVFASDAVGAPRAPDVPAATSAPVDDLLSATEEAILDAELPLCLGADYVVGPAIYGEIEVVVAIDEGRDLALAYDPVSCTEVARARLP